MNKTEGRKWKRGERQKTKRKARNAAKQDDPPFDKGEYWLDDEPWSKW
jgi:hypothetical protein